MKDDQKVLSYLTQVKGLVDKTIMTLPEDFNGQAYIRKHHVHLDLQGPRLGLFTLVLGSEAPELVYDEQYIGFQMIPGSLDEIIGFTEETIHDVTAFILSEEPLVVHKSSIFRRPYLCIPSSYGPEWKLKKFS